MYSVQTFPLWDNLPLAAPGRPVITMVILQIDSKESDGGGHNPLGLVLVKLRSYVHYNYTQYNRIHAYDHNC